MAAEIAFRPPQEPIRIAVTGGAGQIGYALVPLIANGDMLGRDRRVILQLLDLPMAMDALKGVAMELRDCAFPCVADVIATDDPAVAFKDSDICVLVGSFPRKQGMERKDLLEKNANIFKAQGKAINDNAKPNVKVLVVGNPANTNALITHHFAPRVPAKNISALTRLDHNRCRSQVAMRADVAPDAVKNVIIWGNHSSTQFPDVAHAHVDTGLTTSPVLNSVSKEWAQGEMLTTVRKRGAAILAARKLSSAASAARAIVDHVHDWVIGTKGEEHVSMAVLSDGSYGVAEGIVYSFPVRCRNGEWHIVQGLPVDAFAQEKMKETEAELTSERDTALAFVGAAPPSSARDLPR